MFPRYNSSLGRFGDAFRVNIDRYQQVSFDSLSALVIGSFNTDIVGFGFPTLVKQGEIGYGTKLKVGPGGKSRYVGQMLAALLGQGKVAMVGRTTQDPFGLWRPPVDALIEAGVDCSGIRFVRFDKETGWPGITLIAMDEEGKKHTYVVEGVNSELSPDDLLQSDHLFRAVARNKGMLILSLEIPFGTAIFAIQKAREHNVKVMMDPGGARTGVDVASLVNNDIFLLKPNDEEAEKITGIQILDDKSASEAAKKLLSMGPQYVLLTRGKDGAVLASKDGEKLIECPRIGQSKAGDATGCGEQSLAAMCASLYRGKDIVSAANTAVLAGTLQYYREGVIPISEKDLAVAAK